MRLSSLAAALVLTASASPAFAGEQLFIYGSKERSASYEAQGAYNSGTQKITRKGPGQYAIVLAGKAVAARGGNVQVTAYGAKPTFCKVERWRPLFSSDMEIVIRCFDVQGRPADSKFTALFTAAGAGGPPVRFAWAGRPKTRSYTTEAPFSQNGGQAVKAQQLSRGNYQVTFAGVSAKEASGGNVQVTSYGSGANFCSVGRWNHSNGGLGVNVKCFGADGRPAETAFTVLFTPAP